MSDMVHNTGFCQSGLAVGVWYGSVDRCSSLVDIFKTHPISSHQNWDLRQRQDFFFALFYDALSYGFRWHLGMMNGHTVHSVQPRPRPLEVLG